MSQEPVHPDQVERGLPVGAPAPQRRRRAARAGEAVRLGAKDAAHKEWYYLLVRGSWATLVFIVFLAFLIVNATFGTAYWLVSDQILNSEGTWGEGFAFSVQTLFTIGYGYLAPIGPVAHLLVTVESLVGLMMTAVTTGLVFARVSRPRAKVMFSRPLLVAPMDGVPTLTFRVANERGNDVLDASVRLVALIDEVTPEGHTLRRMRELTPVRGFSPIFRLSWVVMHRLDESSPLRSILVDGQIDDRFIGVVCLLSAYDETYGGVVHAQHAYGAEHIRFNERLVDVLTELEDGRFVIDYRKFHDTVPLDLPR